MFKQKGCRNARHYTKMNKLNARFNGKLNKKLTKTDEKTTAVKKLSKLQKLNKK